MILELGRVLTRTEIGDLADAVWRERHLAAKSLPFGVDARYLSNRRQDAAVVIDLQDDRLAGRHRREVQRLAVSVERLADSDSAPVCGGEVDQTTVGELRVADD